MEDTITVITICYNSAKTIENTFRSLLDQTDTRFEYIIVDGMSTDGTTELIKRYEEQFRNTFDNFEFICEKDTGIYNAMNKGIRRASGTVIGILNSDDTYEPDTIEIIKSNCANCPEVDVFHGLMRYISFGQLTMIHGLDSSRLNSGMIEHPTCFVRKKVYDEHGLFDESYRFVADYDFMVRLKHEGCHFKLIENILANYNEDGAGNCYESRLELLKVRKKYGIASGKQLMIQRIKLFVNEHLTK